jgi:hypothetical protein
VLERVYQRSSVATFQPANARRGCDDTIIGPVGADTVVTDTGFIVVVIVVVLGAIGRAAASAVLICDIGALWLANGI